MRSQPYFISNKLLSDMTTIVNIRKKELNKRGIRDFEEWNSQPNTLYIGRNMVFYVKGTQKSKWSNPYSAKKFGREQCLRLYEDYLRKNPGLMGSLDELKGKELGCWCYPDPCHGNVLIKLLKEKHNPTSIHTNSPADSSANPSSTTNMWYQPYPTLYIHTSKDLASQGNIAAFDLDWTLAAPLASTFPKTPTDLHLLPNRLEVLQDLVKKGWTLVIFTNQKASRGRPAVFNQQKINYFLSLVKLPMIVMMATGQDQFRKPQIGMWDTLKQVLTTPITQAFYCGDAAGRPQDFSDSDKQFAVNLKIPFYIPEQLFPATKVDLPGGKSLVLFVGMPGSGKSTYFNPRLKPLDYLHLNQDLLKTKQKMLKSTEQAMKESELIAVDATNPTQAGRQAYYDLAKQYSYQVTVIWFVRDGKYWNKQRAKPVPPVAYGMYAKRFEEPTPNNTPGNIYQIV